MDKQKKEDLKKILTEAKKAPKGSYSVYNSYSSRIFDIDLSPKDGDQAFRKLANILKV